MKTDDEVQFLKAVWFGEIEKVKKFLDSEAYPDLDVNFEKMSNTDGMMSALDIAASLGRDEILGLLLKDPRVSKKPNEHGRTALYLAVSYRQVKTCQMLISNCSILAEGDFFKSANYLAENRILSAKTKEDKDKSTAIRKMLKIPTFVSACRTGNLEKVKSLVNDGVDVNGISREGSGLLVASINGREEVVDYLLTLPEVNVDQKDSRGKFTTLHMLSGPDIGNHTKNSTPKLGSDLTIGASIAKKLINAGANVNVRGGKDKFTTPICLAVGSNRIDMVKVLLSSGADLSLKYPTKDGSEFDIFELTRFNRPAIYQCIKNFVLSEEGFNSNKKISVLANKFSGIIIDTTKSSESNEEISASVKSPC